MYTSILYDLLCGKNQLDLVLCFDITLYQSTNFKFYTETRLWEERMYEEKNVWKKIHDGGLLFIQTDGICTKYT